MPTVRHPEQPLSLLTHSSSQKVLTYIDLECTSLHFFPPLLVILSSATENVPASLSSYFTQTCTEASDVRASLLASGLRLCPWGLTDTAAPGSYQMLQLCAAGSWCSLEINKILSFKSQGWLLFPPASLLLLSCLIFSLAWPAEWTSEAILVSCWFPLCCPPQPAFRSYSSGKGWKQITWSSPSCNFMCALTSIEYWRWVNTVDPWTTRGWGADPLCCWICI